MYTLPSDYLVVHKYWQPDGLADGLHVSDITDRFKIMVHV